MSDHEELWKICQRARAIFFDLPAQARESGFTSCYERIGRPAGEGRPKSQAVADHRMSPACSWLGTLGFYTYPNLCLPVLPSPGGNISNTFGNSCCKGGAKLCFSPPSNPSWPAVFLA
ncbi:hypothetical protein llap_10368 [Limosa lapponica baueri]|uniref:Uncharacterized protein n=1 Tax=Limosa lapponica baueri TaxID=1758121 RepID=A0A2I0TZS5_LIMLA|nr:hypothetical protein llap_10368 [Limosa lapponica baueri]